MSAGDASSGNMNADSGFLGLGDKAIEALVRPVTVGPIDGPDDLRFSLRRRFAVAAFSTLAEPGDSDAVVLLSAVGPTAALRALVERWPAERILDHVRAEDDESARRLAPRIGDAVERWTPRLSLAVVTRALESAARLGATLVAPHDDLWPVGLSSLGAGEPIALWVRGDPALLTSLARSIALVGARAATAYGEHLAMEFAAGLSDRGFAITSGGAYGIDGAVHRSTLASRQTTIAFLAGGVDRLYPAGHSELLRRIADTGLLIGELPCGSSPTRWRFLQRNRLIAAASRATVVVEAGARSGSLNTAGHAAAIGRPLGAVPGPVTSPASAGCHRLIREYDAVCVTTADEMAELAGLIPSTSPHTPLSSGGGTLNDSTGSPSAAAPPEPRSDDLRILDALSSRTGRSVPEIATRSGMSVREVVARLGRLELEGRLQEGADGWRTLSAREGQVRRAGPAV